MNLKISTASTQKEKKTEGWKNMVSPTTPTIVPSLMANLFALPASYWVMKEWLNGFAYRTDFPCFLFLGVMMVTFFLVILSAGHSAIMAGRKNPVEVIRNS
ncbi:MAG: hypothetical protein ABIR06_17195 [Cyclobacteriaceae bacterium]